MSRIDEALGARILAFAKKGLSDRAIVAELGPEGPSRATVARYRLAKLGPIRIGSAPVAIPSEPEPMASGAAELPEPEPMPADDASLDEAPVALLQFWHEEAKKGHALASAVGNLASMARFADSGARCAGALLRAMPPPSVDINDAPDIRAAAERGKKLLFETLENIIANRKLLADEGKAR